MALEETTEDDLDDKVAPLKAGGMELAFVADDAHDITTLPLRAEGNLPQGHKRARVVVEPEPGTQVQQSATAVQEDRNRRCECGKDTPGTYRCTRRVHGPPGTYCPKCTGRTCECECKSCRVAYDGVEEHTEESDREPEEHALMFGDEVPTSEPISMRGTKRRRDEPEPTAEGTSGGTAAALPAVSLGNGNPDGAWPVLMRHRRAIRMTKNLIMVWEIKRLCADCMADPALSLSAIADVLATNTDSEDEDDGSGRRVMLPPDEVVGCDQQ